MENLNRRDEFLTLLSNLLIVGLAAALPIYTDGTWLQIGEKKFILFQNLSLFCLGLWILCALAGKIFEWRKGNLKLQLCPLDVFMLLYFAVVLVSTLCSPYLSTAVYGFREWHMGALSQLLFVGIYFFVSRYYKGERYPIWAWEGTFCLIVLLGLLQRMGCDVLGFTKGMDLLDWQYSHMLSTIGNINWFCGYCSVGIVPALAGYLDSKNKKYTPLLYSICVLGMTLLIIQGSDMGLALAGLELILTVIWSFRNSDILLRSFALAAGVFFSVYFYGHMVIKIGERARYSIPVDSVGLSFYTRQFWLFAGLFLTVSAICLYELIKKGIGINQRTILTYLVCIFVFVCTVSCVVVIIPKLAQSENWGSGRGEIWKLAIHAFRENTPFRKLFGVGPDCFAEYVYSAFSGNILPNPEGQWSDAVFANAHNEWLNHLVNLGIMGVCAYLGIFIVGFLSYRQKKTAILALLSYGAVSIVGFQQCLSTPLFFMTLGLCEAERRKDKKQNEVGKV